MPSTSNKAYESLLIEMDRLAEGVKKHAANLKVMAVIKEGELRAQKQELENLRLSYLEKEQQARLAYDQFEKKFKSVQKDSSNCIRILKGIFGTKAEELIDFGIVPEKSKTSKRSVIF